MAKQEPNFTPAVLNRAKAPSVQHGRGDGEEYALVDEDKIYRKVDMRILPFLFLCYFLQFLDKVSHMKCSEIRNEVAYIPRYPLTTRISWAFNRVSA